MLFNAKDEKIIQDYSQQRCILNQTSSGKPVVGALFVLVTLIGVHLVGVPFLGGRGTPNIVTILMLRTRKLFTTIPNKGVF